MNLWARFAARRKARKAERQAIAAIKQQNRVEAEANLRRQPFQYLPDSCTVLPPRE